MSLLLLRGWDLKSSDSCPGEVYSEFVTYRRPGRRGAYLETNRQFGYLGFSFYTFLSD
jgi:hypothetical protein